jgi:hypothetical protein
MAFPDLCVSLANITPSAKLLTLPLARRAAAALRICSNSGEKSDEYSDIPNFEIPKFRV